MDVSRSHSSEAGFALIEVIVSAVVLAIVALAVLSGIDAANGASAREKARAVASNLAEQDQERLRAMPVGMLKNPPQQLPIDVDGVTYRIKSEAKWITDDFGGEPKCGVSSTGPEVEYLHIVTTVESSIVGREIPPVVVDSLVAPTTEWAEGHGTLGVKVVDRTNTNGIQGITVSATSPGFTPAAQVTNADGCAVFKSIPVGSYTLTLNTPGFIDRNGNQTTTANQTVVQKTVSFATMQYDRATQAKATVTTHVPGSSWSAAGSKPSKARSVSVTNGASVGLLRTFTPGADKTTVDATGLFPFAENSYTFFTGRCGYARPDTYTTNYFQDVNSAAALLADPAQAQPQPVAVRQPPVNIRVMRDEAGNREIGDGDVSVWAVLQKPSGSSDSCSEPAYELTTKPWPGGDWGSAPRTSTGQNGRNRNHWASQPGTEFDPGLPFGKYTLCVRDNRTNRGATISEPYDNTSPDGGAVFDVDTGTISSWRSSRCDY